MRLMQGLCHDMVHWDWLKQKQGAYEWWYFDALSEDGRWSLACIWFLGNPFSPYYHLSQQGRAADPFIHNALFFALHRDGKLFSYHFTRFPRSDIAAEDRLPLSLRFGPNTLRRQPDAYVLQIKDINGNGHSVQATMTFTVPQAFLSLPEFVDDLQGRTESHFWFPAAPVCRVSGKIMLQGAQDALAEQIRFSGSGYHDHNWGALPFGKDLQEWYWARAAYPEGQAAVLYHVVAPAQHALESHLLLFENNQLVLHDPQAHVSLSQSRYNAFLTPSAQRITVQSSGTCAVFHLGKRLDSSPFYLRSLADSTLTREGQVSYGKGMAEYFRPRFLGARLAASATKARIVAR